MSLNVRSGPGTSYSIIGKLNGGDVVELKAKNNGWYKVKLSSGTIGWVSASYISETSEGTKKNQIHHLTKILNLIVTQSHHLLEIQINLQQKVQQS